MELHFETQGRREPLVILHGLFGSLDNWRTISSKLAPHFKVLTVDQRNHGQSPHSFDMNYEVMADDIEELLRSQRLKSAYILGHSMGGKTAMQLALRYPEVVGKLIVADVAPRTYPPRHLKIILGMLSLDLNRFHSRREMEAALAPAIADVGTRQFLLKNVGRNAERGFYWKLGLEELKHNYDRLIEPVSARKAFQGPTLFIRGEKSDFLVENDFELIKPLFPNARLKVIPGAGHLLHVENPSAFLATVLEFLQEN
jgi:esterase